ncbi:MAG TPA: hypothetical protein PK671_25640, partial [Candidatus Obscuribacter sp.]|nr:hypothetical protein [Candidatus Obscuribacter sp.]
MSEILCAKRVKKRANAFIRTAALLFVFSSSTPFVCAAGPVNETALRSAWSLYTAQKYRESADAFEALIASSTPNARLYYYAALALRACNRNARAKQLCQYIANNFPSTQEAGFAARLFPGTVSSATASSSGAAADPVPASLKGKSTEEMLKTEEGRKYVAEQLAKKESSSAKAGNVSPMLARWRESGRPGARVFSPEEIAREG